MLACFACVLSLSAHTATATAVLWASSSYFLCVPFRTIQTTFDNNYSESDLNTKKNWNEVSCECESRSDVILMRLSLSAHASGFRMAWVSPSVFFFFGFVSLWQHTHSSSVFASCKMINFIFIWSHIRIKYEYLAGIFGSQCDNVPNNWQQSRQCTVMLCKCCWHGRRLIPWWAWWARTLTHSPGIRNDGHCTMLRFAVAMISIL